MKTINRNLTPKQKKVLDFINFYTKKNKYSPSLEEISSYLKLKAISTVHQYIETLKNKGYLKKEENIPRSLSLLNNNQDISEIPLLGYIAAGQPIEVIENPELLQISKQLLQSTGNHYALKVKGDSMVDEGICDGDIVVIKEQKEANNGDTIVAIINKNEATLKKFFREKNRVRLQPANQSFLPIFTDEIEIRGVVVNIIRNFKNEKIKLEPSQIIKQKNQFINLPNNIEPLVLIGDVLKSLEKLPDKSIDLIVTSPPYYQQRNYEVNGEIGREQTIEAYINKLLEVANELKRVLKDTGSYFLNIGDKYIDKEQQLIPFKLAIGMQKNGWVIRNVIIWHKSPNPMPTSVKDRFNDTWEPVFFFVKNSGKYYHNNYYFDLDPLRIPHKTKSEIELPLTLTEEEYFKIKEKLFNNKKMSTDSKFLGNEKNRGASPGARKILYGEYYTKQRKFKIDNKLEEEIINYLRMWRKIKKINSKDMDEIMKKKDTAGHWFRLDHGRSLPTPKDWIEVKKILKFDNRYDKIMTEEHYVLQTVKNHPHGKNPGNVWNIAPGKLKEAHFAVFPDELPRKIIQVCCPENGIVLDPFAGSGTTGKVAIELKKRSILIDIKSDYVNIMKRRCGKINTVYINKNG